MDFTNWDPLKIGEVVSLLDGMDANWMFAGGYALELFVGHSYREHGDIDILMDRKDQLTFQKHLTEWELFYAKPQQLIHWPTGLYLEKPIQSIWCRSNADASWQLEVMFFDTIGADWIYKRDSRITRELVSITEETETQINYLAPEVQLLYKSKPPFRDKDQLDFEICLPLLGGQRKLWLLNALSTVYQENHIWIPKLKN